MSQSVLLRARLPVERGKKNRRPAPCGLHAQVAGDDSLNWLNTKEY